MVPSPFTKSSRRVPGKWVAWLWAALFSVTPWTGRSEPSDPLAQGSADQFSSGDGSVTVQRPPGGSWDCIQSRQKQSDSVLTTVKCRRNGPGEFFFLTARDYQMNDPVGRSAQELSEAVYQRSYEALYSRVKYLARGAVKHHGRDAYDVKFDAQHDRLGAIRKVERVVVEGKHIIILSGEGHRDLFDQLQEAIDNWFATTQFSALPPMTSPPP